MFVFTPDLYNLKFAEFGVAVFGSKQPSSVPMSIAAVLLLCSPIEVFQSIVDGIVVVVQPVILWRSGEATERSQNQTVNGESTDYPHHAKGYGVVTGTSRGLFEYLTERLFQTAPPMFDHSGRRTNSTKCTDLIKSFVTRNVNPQLDFGFGF